jgi:hypothetical protein
MRGVTETQEASQQLVETSAELRRLVQPFKIKAGEQGLENCAASPVESKAAHAGA